MFMLLKYFVIENYLVILTYAHFILSLILFLLSIFSKRCSENIINIKIMKIAGMFTIIGISFIADY